MEIERVETNEKLSKIVVYKGIAYLAGQVGDDLEGNVESQTRETLDKIDVLLAQAGTSKERILTAQVWLKDMADAPRMNEVWQAWMPKGFAPARACVGSPLATTKHLVEIKVEAAI